MNNLDTHPNAQRPTVRFSNKFKTYLMQNAKPIMPRSFSFPQGSSTDSGSQEPGSSQTMTTMEETAAVISNNGKKAVKSSSYRIRRLGQQEPKNRRLVDDEDSIVITKLVDWPTELLAKWYRNMNSAHSAMVLMALLLFT
jgi:hypothetical protein